VFTRLYLHCSSICPRIDHCNSLFIVLPKVRLSTLQTVLNASSRPIVRLPRFSRISSFMALSPQLNWLSFTDRIKFKALLLVLKSQLCSAPKYLCDDIRLFSSSRRPLQSSYRHDRFLPCVRITMAQTRSFASIGPSFWNCLPARLQSSILFALSLFARLSLVSNLTFFLELKPSDNASVWLVSREGYMYV